MGGRGAGSGAKTLDKKIASLQAKTQKNISTLKTGDYIGGKRKDGSKVAGYVEKITKNNITVATSKGSVTIPKSGYGQHLSGDVAKQLEPLINKRAKNIVSEIKKSLKNKPK